MEEKERHIVPLNLNIDLRRLTQLFGRSLYIKYFIKNTEVAPLLRRRSSMNMPLVRADDENYGGGEDIQPMMMHEDQ